MALFSLENERPEITPPVFAWMHKISLPLIWVLIFLNPIPYGTSIKEVCYYLAAVFFLVLVLTRKIPVRFNTPLAIPFALYAGWVIIGTFFALDKPGSLNDLGAHLLKNIWLYYMLCYYFSSRARLNSLGWTVIIATVLFASVSMGYYYLYLGNDILSRYGTGFTRFQTNVIGYATLFAALLSLHLYRSETRRFHRVLLVVCLVITLAASIMGQSRGTLLAVAVSFFVMIKSKRLFLLLCAGLVLFVAVSPLREKLNQSIAYYDRLYPAFYSIEIIKDHPIVGAGYSLDALGDPAYIDPEVYRPRVPAWVRDTRYIHPVNLRFVLPHSMFFNIPARTGLVGLALYLVLLFVFAREGWRLYTKGSDRFIRSWGLLCLAAMGMYVTKGAVEPVDTAMVEVILYTLFAMLTITWFQEKEIAARPAEKQDQTAIATGRPPMPERADKSASPLA